jgi:multisubunit Na+/H+ antiporter MnhB subunit
MGVVIIGAVVAGVVIAIVLVLIILVAIFLTRRKMKLYRSKIWMHCIQPVGGIEHVQRVNVCSCYK